MKKILSILIPVLALTLLVSACAKKPEVNTNTNQKVDASFSTSPTPTNSPAPEGTEVIDSDIDTSNSFLPNSICPRDLSLDDEIVSQSRGYYGGYVLNGCLYNFQTQEFEASMLSDNNCKKNIEQEITAHKYGILNGCLYRNGQRVFEKNILEKILLGDFGKEYKKTNIPSERKPMGESANEWFRFEQNGKLYIFLRGASGCGGCSYNGPYLEIDLRSDEVVTRSADLPYLLSVVPSPNRKRAVEIVYEQIPSSYRIENVKLYVFDFVTFDKRVIYEIPDTSAILMQGDGFYLISNAVRWLDDSSIKVQFFSGIGLAEEKYISKNGYTHTEYIETGEPIVLTID